MLWAGLCREGIGASFRHPAKFQLSGIFRLSPSAVSGEPFLQEGVNRKECATDKGLTFPRNAAFAPSPPGSPLASWRAATGCIAA